MTPPIRERSTALQVCRICELPAPQVEIPAGRRMCTACIQAVKAKWRYQHRKKLRSYKREYMRRWRAANPGYSGRKTKQEYKPDQQAKYHATYRAKPGVREKENADSRAYYAANRERILAQKKTKKAHQQAEAQS